MRGSVDSKTVALLARMAGFSFSMERCEQLARRLERLLGEAGRVQALDLATEEPIAVFRPRETVLTSPKHEEGDVHE